MKVIVKPDITLYDAFRVSKDTNIELNTELYKTSVKDLNLHSESLVSGPSYKGVYSIDIELKDGDLIVKDPERGLIKPVEELESVSDAIEDLQTICNE